MLYQEVEHRAEGWKESIYKEYAVLASSSIIPSTEPQEVIVSLVDPCTGHIELRAVCWLAILEQSLEQYVLGIPEPEPGEYLFLQP